MKPPFTYFGGRTAVAAQIAALRPGARAAEGWKRSTRASGRLHRAADLAEDARWVREHGGHRHASNREVALRLGVEPAAPERALLRAGHYARDAEAQAKTERQWEAG